MSQVSNPEVVGGVVNQRILAIIVRSPLYDKDKVELCKQLLLYSEDRVNKNFVERLKTHKENKERLSLVSRHSE
jgi:hypothetical protein